MEVANHAQQLLLKAGEARGKGSKIHINLDGVSYPAYKN